MNNERDVKTACKKLFAELNVWYFMPVMNGFGVQGIPDIVGACNGHMFGVECKYGSNKPTPLQVTQITRMQSHKIPVWVVSDRNFAEFAKQFSEWVDAHR